MVCSEITQYIVFYKVADKFANNYGNENLEVNI